MMNHQTLISSHNIPPTTRYRPPRQTFLVISNQHLTRAGGIGSFAKAMSDMAHDLGWTFRVVTDRPPIGPGKAMLQLISEEYICGKPEKATPTASQFAKAQVDPARTRNFQRSLLAAQSAYGDPDLVLVCTPEAAVGANAINWATNTKVVFYTHHENLFHTGPKRGFDKFDASYDAFLRSLLQMKQIVATQTQHNLDRLLAVGLPPARGVVLHMPMPDRECLQPRTGTGTGVLFIGRHEQRKNWAVFLDMLEKTGIPGKVLTNSKGFAKFASDFARRGLHGEVRAELSGQAKADFIQSARVAFHPSFSESYGYCAMETLAAGLPTLCIEEHGWWENFRAQGVMAVPRRGVASALRNLYENPVAPSYDWHAHEAATAAAWKAFLK